MMVLEPVAMLFSLIASILRLGAGRGAVPVAVGEPLILYEFEGCPFCRVAREAVSASGVPVLVRPCPKGGKRFRPRVAELGGKAQFPYLVDPNTDEAMYESSDIARYLRRTYGGGRPLVHWLGPINLVSSQFAVLARAMAGTFARRAKANDAPLEYTAAERSPGGRLVKERLCELEQEYLWRSQDADNGSAPRLFDPSTGEEIAGSRAVRVYLNRRYRR